MGQLLLGELPGRMVDILKRTQDVNGDAEEKKVLGMRGDERFVLEAVRLMRLRKGQS